MKSILGARARGLVGGDEANMTQNMFVNGIHSSDVEEHQNNIFVMKTLGGHWCIISTNCSYKKGGFIIKTPKKQLCKKRGRLLTKKSPRRECPGAEHIGWIHPNHFPTIPNHFLYMLMGFVYIYIYIYISIYFNGFCIKSLICVSFWH